jgi:hypothetical protein
MRHAALAVLTAIAITGCAGPTAPVAAPAAAPVAFERHVTAQVPETRTPAATKPRPTTPPTAPKPTEAKQPATAGCDWHAEYRAAIAGRPGTWHVRDRGSWGATDTDAGEAWIAPRTPCRYVRSVVIHEGCHVQQGRIYGSRAAAVAALAPVGGLDINADECARHLGATWFHYSHSPTPAQRAAGKATARGATA